MTGFELVMLGFIIGWLTAFCVVFYIVDREAKHG